MRQYFFLWVSACLLISLNAATAADSIQNLQSHLQAYQQLSGQFQQRVSSDNNADVHQSSGHFWIKKPNKFRWQYVMPYAQEITSNGLRVWVYDEDLEQVTIKPSSTAIASSPLAIILGSSSLEDYFTVSEVKKEDGLQWLSLIPINGDTGFESVQVGFENSVLAKMLMQDNFGQTTQLDFSQVTIHSNLDDAMFEFKQLEGVDVFDETDQ